MKTNTTNTTTEARKTLIDVILQHGIEEDTPVKFEGRQVFKSSTTKKVYICNPETKRAFQYNADGTGCKAISLEVFRTQLKAVLARVQRETEADKRIRDKVQQFEAEKRTDHNAVLLDAEREDSKFDYRRSEEIFSRSEAEAYEDLGGFFEDEEGVISLGHHKAVYLRSEVERAKTYVGRDGQTYEQKAYLKMTFEVEGKEFTTRAYRMHFNSFKIQANQKFHGIFTYTKESQALEELVGQTFDIWVTYNDMIRELQADFYDKAAYAARKAEQAKAGFVRGGYGRPTENKATR